MAKAISWPPPGSEEAKKKGCTCPVLDNNNGRGVSDPKTGDGARYWISATCPIHAKLTDGQ
jgi:hypothetical protein